MDCFPGGACKLPSTKTHVSCSMEFNKVSVSILSLNNFEDKVCTGCAARLKDDQLCFVSVDCECHSQKYDKASKPL